MRRVRHFVVSAAALLVGAASAQVPASLTPLLAKGQRALDGARYAEAREVGRSVVAKAPIRFEGHRLLAYASLGLDRPDEAEAAFRQALRFAPVAARPDLQKGLGRVVPLRRALLESSKARAQKAAGDPVGAARALEAAYRILPSRTAFGFAAADLFESAGESAEARRLLEEMARQGPATSPAATRLAALDLKIQAERQRATEELAQRIAEGNAAANRRIEAEERAKTEVRRAEAAERKRAEAKREADERAEEERQRAERERLRREENERLNAVLGDQKRSVSDAEQTVGQAQRDADDADRAVRKADDKADDAKGKRDRARREKEALEDKLRDAKESLQRQTLQTELRGAENAYRDAKDDYESAKRRLDDAKSRQGQARSDAESAQRRLDAARQAVRDTEAALARLTNP